MPLVFVTGISGAGKSAVCEELARRGYDAHDTDREDNATWVNRRTGEVTTKADMPSGVGPDDWLREHEWRVDRPRVERLARLGEEGVVFLCGGVANDIEVWDLFSLVIYLAIDEQTLRDRLASRTTNDFGKAPEELAAVLEWHKVGEADYRSFGAVIIDATVPLPEVVDMVLAAAVASPVE